MSTAFDVAKYATIYPEGVEKHWWQIARNRIIAREVRKFGRGEGQILDVGCGIGIATKFIRESGVDCIGVEIADIPVRESVAPYVKTNTRAEDIAPEIRNRITGITLLDVIEHNEDPREVLAPLIEAFPAARYILVTVPARPELWSNYDEFNDHFRRYTLDMIRDFGAALGLRTVFAGYFCHFAYVAGRAIIRWKHERTIHKKKPVSWKRWVHWLVGWAFVAEYLLLPRRIWGSSIIALFEVGAATSRSSHE